MTGPGEGEQLELIEPSARSRPKPVSGGEPLTETEPVDKIQAGIASVFDLRPAAIVHDLDLLRPIYKATAAYGHFGRTHVDGVSNAFTWERTDRIDALQKAVKG